MGRSTIYRRGMTRPVGHLPAPIQLKTGPRTEGGKIRRKRRFQKKRVRRACTLDARRHESK